MWKKKEKVNRIRTRSSNIRKSERKIALSEEDEDYEANDIHRRRSLRRKRISYLRNDSEDEEEFDYSEEEQETKPKKTREERKTRKIEKNYDISDEQPKKKVKLENYHNDKTEENNQRKKVKFEVENNSFPEEK